jgi:hypothetical protein
MSSKVVTPPYSVTSAYEDFIEAFRIAGQNANLEVPAPATPLHDSFTRSGNPETAVFKTCLYLKGLPCRRLGSGRRLDIVIKAVETFKVPKWLLTKSTVSVNYIVVSDPTAKLAQSLHYDFIDTGQKDHPFFHVHLTDGRIREDDLRNAGFRLNLLEQPNECWVTTRIPTPDMTFASVLYCVVADHLGAGHFKEFAKKVDSIQGRLPHPEFDALKRSLRTSSKHFKSSHWFAHMLERR